MDLSSVPVWNLSNIFEDFNSVKYRETLAGFGESIEKLNSLLSEGPSTDKAILEKDLTSIIKIYNKAGAAYEELLSYTYCIYSTDTSNPDAMTELNRVEETAGGLYHCSRPAQELPFPMRENCLTELSVAAIT